MPQKKPSLDEVLAKREGSIVHTDRGDAITKAFRAPASWNADTRSARFVMSSQAEDRYGDIVVTAGIEIDTFLTNPVVLLFHASRNWPVGQWSELEKKTTGRPPRLEGTATFVEQGLLPEADTAASLIGAGVLRACSIGFLPLDWEMIKDEDGHWTYGLEFLKSELVECSIVSVPASPQALVKAAGDDPEVARHLIQQSIDDWRREAEGLGLSRDTFIEAIRRYDPSKIISVPSESNGGEKAAAPTMIKAEDLDAIVTKAVNQAVAASFAAANLPKDVTDPVDQGVKDAVQALSVEVDETEIKAATDQAISQLGEGLLAGIAKMFRVKPKTAEPERADPPEIWPAHETCSAEKFLELPEEKRKELTAIVADQGSEAADAALKAYFDALAPELASAEQVAAAKEMAAATRARLTDKGLIAA